MAERKELSLTLREEIISAWKVTRDKVSVRQLAKNFNLATSTVHHLIRRYNETGSVANAPRTGRRRTLGVKERGILAKLAEEDPGKSAPKLAKEFCELTGKKVSSESIRRCLKNWSDHPGGDAEGTFPPTNATKAVQEEEEEEANDQSEDFEDDTAASEPSASPAGLMEDESCANLEETMEDAEEMENCFLCNRDNLLPSDKDKQGNGGDGMAQFTWKRLLEIPEGRWREYRLLGGGGIGLCELCGGEVTMARYLYRQMEEAVKEFRRIQGRLVQRISEVEGGGDGSPAAWRQFVRRHKYQFSGPFVIGGERQLILEATVKQEVETDDIREEEDAGDWFGGDLGSPEEEGGDDEDGDEEEWKLEGLKTEENDQDWTPPVLDGDMETSMSSLRRSGRKRKAMPLFDESAVAQGPAARKKKTLKKDGVGGSGQQQKKGSSSCELCGDNVKSANVLEHVRNHVGDEMVSKCPNSNCPLLFTNCFARRRHLLQKVCKMAAGTLANVLKSVGESEHAYLCQECGVSCSDIDNLQTHLAEYHDGNSKDLKCPVTSCQEMLGSRQSVHVHLFQKHDLVKRALALQKCAICSERLWVEDMESHLRSRHGAAEVIKCCVCPHLFSSRQDLIEHLYQTHAQSTFTCDICSSTGSEQVETFQNHIDLREHYFKEHQVGSRFLCVLCPDKIFWQKNSLHHHLKNVHQNRQRLTCDICDAAVQEGGTPAPSFPNQSHLQGHKIREHGLKPFLCDICGEGFGIKQLLENHKLIHTGERPFVCPQCGQQFRQSEVLGRHLKGHAEKGDNFKAKGPMKHIRKRVTPKDN